MAANRRVKPERQMSAITAIMSISLVTICGAKDTIALVGIHAVLKISLKSELRWILLKHSPLGALGGPLAILELEHMEQV